MRGGFRVVLLFAVIAAIVFIGCSGCCCKPKDGEISSFVNLSYKVDNVGQHYHAGFQQSAGMCNKNYDEFPAGVPFDAYLGIKSSACVMSVKTSWRKEHNDHMVFYQPWQEKKFLGRCIPGASGQRVTGLAGTAGDVYGFFVSGTDTRGRSTGNSNLYVRFKYIPGISPANTPTPQAGGNCLSQGQMSVSLAWNQQQSGAKWTGNITEQQINAYCSGRNIKKIIIPYKVSCFAQPAIVMTDWRVKIGNTEYSNFTCNESSNQCVKNINIPLVPYAVEARSPNWHSEDPNFHPTILNFQPVMVNLGVQ